MRRGWWRDLGLVLTLIARRGCTLGKVACPVLGRLGVRDRARYEELLVGPACAARKEWLGSGRGLIEKCGIVAIVEALSSRRVSGGVLGWSSSDGVLCWRHMAVSARIVTPE